MLLQKLQSLKIPDTLEAALEYLGTERWVCWYWDDEETLLVEDINSSYFGNQKAWLLFCSYIDNNTKVNKGSDYNYFEGLITGKYSSREKHEAETKITETLSSPDEKAAYLFDRQARELYSGSPSDIQTLIKQPKTLVMWAELQGETCNESKFEEFEEKLISSEPKIDEWVLTKALLKLVVVWFGFAVLLPVPWVSAMHLLQSFGSHLPFVHSTDSIEQLKADLALENQTAELLKQEQALKVSK